MCVELVSNVSGEILAALSASVIVAPAVGIIDRAISVNARLATILLPYEHS